MFSEAALLAWSGMGFFWWLVAWRLVAAEPREDIGRHVDKGENAAGPFLTVFKPLPPLGAEHFHEARGLASFIGQLDEHSELLLGIHEADRQVVEPFLNSMRVQHPLARVEVVWRDEPDAVANPKIAWMKILAPHANGGLWMWSDADIVAPAGFLRAARTEYAAAGARLLTWPYVIREVNCAPARLDALFVNLEFFPGVLLLRRLGPVDFGLGAGMLFSREDFVSHVGWKEIGASLADDFVLGQKLKPVRIGRAILTTAADAESWGAAVRHYLRWSKTIRWNRPFGTAARIIVLPALGWMTLIAWHPGHLFGWLGLLAVMQMDVLFAALICRRLGCHLGLRHLALAELWSVGRIFVWLLGWLPGPVMWRGQAWQGPRPAPE